MIQFPIVFLSMLVGRFYGPAKLNIYKWIIHPYLPKQDILIFRNATFLFTENNTLLITDYKFVELFNLPPNANIIDIGGGDSHFVDALLDKGYQNIYVLDISTTAIERTKQRLGERASKVHWIISDVTKFEPPVHFDFWHDRAVFHFLTTEDKICKYVSIAEDAIKKDGYLILGTFSETGPKECSGLEIRQYSEASMSVRFEVAFGRIKCIREDHTTPFNNIQNFLFCSFRRR